MSKIRTFIAVAVSAEVRERASDLVERLRASGADVNWVRPENMHLTLKFLGDVVDSQLGDVCSAVARAAARVAPFEATCRGAGAFPDVRRPRTIWIGVERGAQEMVALHAAIEAALAPAGFPNDHRPYHPHLTIGRLRRSGRGQHRLSELIERNSEFQAAAARVAEAVVFSSVLQKAGPTYDVLARAPLKG
jgi:2'-5' RNA ligase